VEREVRSFGALRQPQDHSAFDPLNASTDSYGCTGTRDYTIVIKCPTITVKPFTLPNGRVNQPCNRTISAIGGNSPYVFTIENGSLPNGITLSADGILSGTPTVQGSFNFTILATDNYGCTGKRLYNLSIAPLNIAQ